MKLALRASSPSPSLRDFRNVQSDAAVKPQIYFFSDVYWNCPNLKERIYNSDFLEYCRKSSTLENKIGTSIYFYLSAGAEKAPAQQIKLQALKPSFFLEWRNHSGNTKYLF